MAKQKPIQFNSIIDFRRIIKSPPTYALLAIVSFALFKDRLGLRPIERSLIPLQPKVCFAQTSQPFAGISLAFNFHSLKTVIDHYRQNISTVGTSGDFIEEHSKEVVPFVAAKTHLRHVHTKLHPLSINREDLIALQEQNRSFPLAISQGEDCDSFENRKLRGPVFLFNFEESAHPENSDEQIIEVRPSETIDSILSQLQKVHAFTTRDKIPRGDETTNPFLPENQENQIGIEPREKHAKLVSHQINKSLSIIKEDDVEEAMSDSYTDDDLKAGTVTSKQAPLQIQGEKPEYLFETEESGVETEESETEDVLALGLAEFIADAHNKPCYNEVSQSPFFEQAARMVHEQLAEDLTNYSKQTKSNQIKRNVQKVFENFPGFCLLDNKPNQQQLAVYAEDPVILNKLSEYVKLFEVADSISTPEYSATFTGEKNKDYFCIFGQSGVYSRQRQLRKTIATNLAKVNERTVSYTEALSAQDVLDKVEALLKNSPHSPERIDRIRILTNVIVQMYETPATWEETLTDFLKPKQIVLENLTLNTNADSDHFLRKDVRTPLGERLLNTLLSNDRSMAVEMPLELHKLKELFTNFQEPEDFSYSDGLSKYLKGILKSILDGLRTCSPKDLNYVPLEVYEKAYTECFKVTIQRLDDQYQNISERERMMIYHAKIVLSCDEQDFQNYLENNIGTTDLEKGPLGIHFIKNKNLAADLLRKASTQRSAFIKTLSEFCSPECAEIIQLIQEEHQFLVQRYFVRIQQITHSLSPQEKQELYNPASLTQALFANSPPLDSLTDNEIEAVIYNHAKTLGLTDIGNGLPSSFKFLSYQTQERFVNTGATPRIRENVEKRVQTNNAQLISLLEEPLLIGHSRQERVEAEFYNFLIEKKLPETLVETICKKLDISTFEELCNALKDGTVAEFPGIGAGKVAKIQEVVDRHNESVANVVTITETQSDTVNPVIKPNARRGSVRGSVRSITAAPSSTLSRAASEPLSQKQSNLLESSQEIKLLKEGPSSL